MSRQDIFFKFIYGITKNQQVIFHTYSERWMSCYERNVYAWKETASLLWDISMDIVCLTFPSFSLLRGLPSLDGKNEPFVGKKRKKRLAQLN